MEMAKIMIVDDAAFMRITIKNMLKKSTHEVVGEAENGKLAVERYKQLSPTRHNRNHNAELDGLHALRKFGINLLPSDHGVRLGAEHCS
jgi:two-component system chemotaxis response regulator CheY